MTREPSGSAVSASHEAAGVLSPGGPPVGDGPGVRATRSAVVPEDGPRDRLTHTQELAQAMCASTTAAEQAWLRDQLVLVNLPVARSVARRYQGRGEQLEDLEQVARLALVKAAASFDPHHGSDFLAYAVPSVTGEVKRHFRDHGWHIRPPRHLQELRPAVVRASSELAQALGREPSVSEIARHLGADLDDVLESLASVSCYRADSLDVPMQQGDGSPPAYERLGDLDPDLALLDDLLSLRPLLDALPERARKVVILTYFKGWSQERIGREIGVTQMQVSRILATTLRTLRQGMTPERGWDLDD